jgi:type IV secretion system protein TrbE
MKWGPSEQLIDWLPWWLPLDPNHPEVILTSSGGLLRAASFAPPDFETASPEELTNHHREIAAALQRFGNGWSIWLDQWRTRSDAYLPECSFGGNMAAQVIDDSRRRYFSRIDKAVFDNSVTIAVHYQPQARDALLNWILDRSDSQAEGNIAFFLEHSSALFGQLRQLTAGQRGVEVLSGNQLAAYLGACVSYEPGPVRFPAGLIARGLATRQWRIDERITIDDRHLATVEVRNFGSETTPLTIEALHELPFECRWVMAVHTLNLEQQRREWRDIRRRWSVKQRGLVSLVGAALARMFGKQIAPAKTNPEIDRALESMDELAAELTKRSFALASLNIHVWGKSEAMASEFAQAVIYKLRRAPGLEARVATLNSAWTLLGDMPGATGKNLRQSREELPVVTCLAPVTGVSTGFRSDWRFGGSALMVGVTRRGVPFYWALNPPGSDFAHTAVVGKSGGGKSTLLAFMAAQFLRYQDATVILFDRHRSFLVTCLCLGGDWIELGSGGVGVQPLRAIHLPEERAWAHGWVLQALRLQRMQMQAHTDAAVSEALAHVAERPPHERTLTRLHSYLSGDQGARQALAAYLAGRSYGEIFDGVVESYGAAPVIGLETENVTAMGELAPLLMSAVFRAVRRDRMCGPNPKLVMWDELGILLQQSDVFAAEINAEGLELRKMQAALVVATQSLSHFDGGKTQALWDQMGNKIYMPHAEAMRPDSFAQYRAKGLLEEQIQSLATARPKGEFLLQTEQVTRLISAQLEDNALAICGAIGELHQKRALALLQQGVKPGHAFTKEWLAETTEQWAAREQVLEMAA